MEFVGAGQDAAQLVRQLAEGERDAVLARGLDVGPGQRRVGEAEKGRIDSAPGLWKKVTRRRMSHTRSSGGPVNDATQAVAGCRSSCPRGVAGQRRELLGIGLEKNMPAMRRSAISFIWAACSVVHRPNCSCRLGTSRQWKRSIWPPSFSPRTGGVEAMQAVRQSRTAGALEVVPRLLRVQLAFEHLQERLEEAVPEHPRYLGPAALLQPRAQRKKDVEARAVVGHSLPFLSSATLAGQFA